MMKNRTSKYSAVACETSSLAREIGLTSEDTASASAPPSGGGVPRFAFGATDGSKLARAPMVMATLSVMPNRSATIVQLPWNAKAVATRTTGLTTGAARMNVVAAYKGTPLARRRRASGITPQSHTGARKPKTLLTRTSGSRCGNQRVSTPSERYCWTNAEAKTPTSRKGSDCKIMLTNTTLKSLRRDGSTSARTMALHFDSGCPFPSGRVPTGAAQPYADRPRRTRTHAEFDSIGPSAPQARRPGTVVSSTASTKASGVRGPRAG